MQRKPLKSIKSKPVILCHLEGCRQPGKYFLGKPGKEVCNFHYWAAKRMAPLAKALLKPIKKANPISKRRKKTGELELFKRIWNNRPHLSQVSGDPLPEKVSIKKWLGYFSHIAPKSVAEEIRLDERYIILMTNDEHTAFGTYGRKRAIELFPGLAPYFELQDQLMVELKRKRRGI